MMENVRGSEDVLELQVRNFRRLISLISFRQANRSHHMTDINHEYSNLSEQIIAQTVHMTQARAAPAARMIAT